MSPHGRCFKLSTDMTLTVDQAYPLWLGLLSAVTFLSFGWDKLCAVRRWHRIPERTLLLLILLGGCFAGWLAVLVWRHKSRKPLFWIALLLATCGHGYLIWARWRGMGL